MLENQFPAENYTSNSELYKIAEGLVAESLGVKLHAPHLRALCDLATSAADFAQELRLSPTVVAAIYLHKLVGDGMVCHADVEASCGERVHWLCAEASRILGERGEVGARGKARARHRVRHDVAAYRDPELGLLAVSTLWARGQVA